MPNKRIAGLRVLCGCLALCAAAREKRPEPAPTVASVLEKQRHGAEVDLFVTETEAAAMSDDEGLVAEGMSYRAIPDRREWTVDRPRPGISCPAMTTRDLNGAWSVAPSSRALLDTGGEINGWAWGDVPEISGTGVVQGRSISMPHTSCRAESLRVTCGKKAGVPWPLTGIHNPP